MSEKLYPLKFTPILKEKIWGGQKIASILNKDASGLVNLGESWEISGVQDDISVVANGFLAGNSLNELIEIYMGDLVGEQVYNNFGLEFPLLIKFIDAKEVLSIQVHPDDKVAKERHNAYGKTEMWYVLQADKGAGLINGFKKDIDKQTYLTALHSGNIENLLNNESVHAGDAFEIPAGRVHAIGAGVLLAEIQQSSDITYRIYDWGRKTGVNGKPRELHTELAQDVINFKTPNSYKINYQTSINKTINIVDCRYFKTNIIEFDSQIEKDYILLDSFIIYMCIEGELEVQCSNGISENLKKGETILLPAAIKSLVLNPVKSGKIIEVYIN